MKKIISGYILLTCLFLFAHEWPIETYLANYASFGIEAHHASKPISLISFKGNEECLEIGCRIGNVSKLITQQIPNGFLTAVDVHPELIKTAQERNSLPNISFQTYTPKNPSWQDESFDYAFSFWEPIWQEDIKSFFAMMYRALKPSGKAMLGCIIEQPTQPFVYIQKTLQKPAWQAYSHYEIPIYIRKN